ncbi:MAG: hypothetical protein ACM3IK_09045 [Sphingomonadaceae bacterium]
MRLLAALALIATLAVPAGVLAGVEKPILEKASKGPCIAPPEVMRREHPDMLKHQRTITVHEGVVGAKVSLQGCIDCHGPAREFCAQCHRYAGVRIDCFQCHASRPAEKK